MNRAGRSNCDSFVFAAVSKSWTGGKPKPATVYFFCFQFSAPKACKMGTHITMTPPTGSSPVPPELLKRIRLKGTAKLVTPAGT